MKDHSLRGNRPTIWKNLIYYRVYQAVILVFAVLLIFIFIEFRTFHNLLTDEEANEGIKRFSYSRMSPLIFIGGFPRSGTTLMRAMLDAHPDVRCGRETRIIPAIVSFMRGFYGDAEKKRMAEAGVTEEIVEKAFSTFILEIMIQHGELAPRLCSKDPFILATAGFVSELFPRAKFLFMVRDGRASVYSAIKRNVTIGGFDFNNPLSCIRSWNKSVAEMYRECRAIGAKRCKMVHYERLVLQPALGMREILKFLEVPWNDLVLHHETQINKAGGVQLSRLEKSSDQIIKPIHVEALARWVGFYPQDVVENMEKIAPMLITLGYDPNANPPNYGTADHMVLQNTQLVHDQVAFWRAREKELNLTHSDIFL